MSASNETPSKRFNTAWKKLVADRTRENFIYQKKRRIAAAFFFSIN